MDYDETVSSLVFSGESTQTVVVRVIDDDLPEPPETFIGRLSFAAVLPPNVHLEPTKVVATIIDNKGVYKY